MIAAYKGISLLSRVIRFMHWSEYSHVAWVSKDGWEIEAWSSCGVRRLNVAHSKHTPGTEVDLFDVDLTHDEVAMLEDWLHIQIGKRYDWRGIFRFLTRRDVLNPRRWFCSALLFAGFLYIRVPLLLRIRPHKVFPGLIVYSPRLRFVRTIRVPDLLSATSTTSNPARPGDMEFRCDN